jgi:S1-C subfamily serine protease
MGVRYTMIIPGSDQAKQYGVDGGALVIGDAESPAIVPNSPASKAGIKTGDVITAIEGKKLNIKQTLADTISQYKIGNTIKLTIIRDGKEQILSLVLEERT